MTTLVVSLSGCGTTEVVTIIFLHLLREGRREEIQFWFHSGGERDRVGTARSANFFMPPLGIGEIGNNARRESPTPFVRKIDNWDHRTRSNKEGVAASSLIFHRGGQS